jgi:hypothetical protein
MPHNNPHKFVLRTDRETRAAPWLNRYVQKNEAVPDKNNKTYDKNINW